MSTPEKDHEVDQGIYYHPMVLPSSSSNFQVIDRLPISSVTPTRPQESTEGEEQPTSSQATGAGSNQQDSRPVRRNRKPPQYLKDYVRD